MLNREKDIIQLINNGNSKAFEQLYKESYVYLCAVGIKYVYDIEIAKEIVNDVFMNIWNRHETLSWPVKSYLLRCVKNGCLNHLRKSRVEEVSLTDVQEHMLSFREDVILKDEHPLSELEDKEFRQKIANAVEQLPPKCREIFVRHLYHNKSYEEIALDLDVSSSTVRGQIRIGLMKLKPLLGDIYPSFVLIFHFFQK